MNHDDLIRALSTVRLQGQLVEKRDDAILVRRGSSVFQAAAADIVDIRDAGNGNVEVQLKPGCTLIRSSVVQTIGRGKIIGVGGRHPYGGMRGDECSECTECTECSDCECTDC